MRRIFFLSLVIFIVIISFLLAMLYVQKNNNTTVTNFEGILRAPCGGINGPYICSAIPFIEYQNKKCGMNLYLETKNSKELWHDQNNIRTTFCFFESEFNEKEFKSKFLDKKVTIVGSMENATVCRLLRKCPEPECSECNEQRVLIPVEIK